METKVLNKNVNCIILMGIPGSGKTALAKTIVTHINDSNNFEIKHIEFDKYLNHEGYKPTLKIFMDIIVYVINMFANDQKDNYAQYLDNPLFNTLIADTKCLYLIIDENFALMSMRTNILLKLIDVQRSHKDINLNIVFIQIECSLECARTRVSRRNQIQMRNSPQIVTETTIAKMYANLTDLKKKTLLSGSYGTVLEKWIIQHTIYIQNDDILDLMKSTEEMQSRANNLWAMCLQHLCPIKDLMTILATQKAETSERFYQAEMDRQINLTNITHGVDKVLRGLIHRQKNTVFDYAKANLTKKLIIQKIRMGQITIRKINELTDTDEEYTVLDNVKNKNCPLETYFWDCFHEK